IRNAENDAHISAFEAVNATVPIADLRWALEHVFSISDNDINRLKAIGAGVAVQNQQYFLGGSGPPYRKLVDSGIPISGGTDASATSPMSPWISLYHMVTGRVASGAVRNAGQQISRMEALRLYTRGSAWHTFDEEDLGSIEVGKLADLVVLSDDYLSVPEDEIRTLSSVLTIIDGKIVHAAAEFSDLALDVEFRRGDCNDDGTVDISDAVCILNWLFLGGTAPGCVAATNVDGVGQLTITDPIYLLTHLFRGGPVPVEPFRGCGTSDLEADRELGCQTPPQHCQQ
ncbi:MAG: amidohydrolase family protein, partial [Planctomycetota bacterium]|nr:amidohydrolase family protein [Planctomycetota bacterium]